MVFLLLCLEQSLVSLVFNHMNGLVFFSDSEQCAGAILYHTVACAELKSLTLGTTVHLLH